ncbi:hypothetical protein Tco_0060443 [Tanacetum coccineum]
MISFVNDVLASLVGTVLILVIIVHQKLRLSQIQNHAIKPLKSSHRLCQVFIRHAILEMRIHSLMIPNLILPMILLTFSIHNPNTYHTLVSYVGTILITVTIVHLKSRLSTIRTRVSIKTLIIFHKLHQVFHPCCEDCGGPHETFQCQPMNEDYYHEQNSCYDSNSFGFDQTQPPQYTVNHPILNAQNEFLNSQNKLMEQMTSICDMVGQIMQKKEEEMRIAEDQAAKDRYWKIPICYDDDEDYTIAITPILSTKEPVDSLIMEDKHLSTSVENLVQIPSEFKGISKDTCDVPVCEDPSTFDALSNHSEILSDYSTSSDDDSYENIEYVDATPPNSELVSLEEVEDVILRDKLSNVYLLISKIEALNDNPTLSSFSDNSFSGHTKETRSGSTTTHANNSLPEYDSFLF